MMQQVSKDPKRCDHVRVDYEVVRETGQWNTKSYWRTRCLDCGTVIVSAEEAK